MKIKQIICNVLFLIGSIAIFTPAVANAATCGGVQTSIITCNETGKVVCYQKDATGKFVVKDGQKVIEEENPANNTCKNGSAAESIGNNGVWGILKLTIQVMTAGVGILAVGGIIYGSILYTSAGGSAEQVKKAVSIITNVVVGILAYIFMFAIINFLIPGGLLS